MMRAAFLGALGVATALTAATPAVAGRNDDAWAACLWQKAPVSASNWLAMPAPKRDYGLGEPEPSYVLEMRLRAACHDRMIAAGKTAPPSFGTGAVRRALIATRPDTLPAEEADPQAYRCDLFFENDPEMNTLTGTDWGFGASRDGKQLGSIRMFFAAKSGGSVGLTEGGGIRRCRLIQTDGSYKDA